MTHFIISRVNIPRELDPSKYPDPAPYKSQQWNEDRVKLLNAYARKSLQQQTCQDFIFVSLWGSHHIIDIENTLKNEATLIIRRGVDEYDEQPFDFEAWKKGENEKQEMDFSFQIRKVIKQYLKGSQGPYLFTNLDCDDCLQYKFVERVQAASEDHVDKAPFYLDVEGRFMLNINKGGRGVKERRTPSPMVSTIEKNIEVFPLRWHHSMMGNHLQGTKVPGLTALQTVNDSNILTRGTGKHAEFNENFYF